MNDGFIIPMYVQAKKPFDYTSNALAYNIRTIILSYFYYTHILFPKNGFYSLACDEHATSLDDRYWASKSNEGDSTSDAIFKWLSKG